MYPKLNSRFPRRFKRLKCNAPTNYQCGGKCQRIDNKCNSQALGMAKSGLEYLKSVEERRARIAIVNAKRKGRTKYVVNERGEVLRDVDRFNHKNQAINKAEQSKKRGTTPIKKNDNVTDVYMDFMGRTMQRVKELEGEIASLKNGHDKAKSNPIKSYSQFKKEMVNVFRELSKKENTRIVPIYNIRRTLGARVSRDEFDKYMLRVRGDGEFYFHDAHGRSVHLLKHEVRDSVGDPNSLVTYFFVEPIGKIDSQPEENRSIGDSEKTERRESDKVSARLLMGGGNNVSPTIIKYRKQLRAAERRLERLEDQVSVLRGTLREDKKKKIASYTEFKKEATKVIEQLSQRENDSEVPIYSIRQKIGTRVSRDDFDKYMLQLRKENILYFSPLNEANNLLSSKEKNDLVKNPVLGQTYYSVFAF